MSIKLPQAFESRMKNRLGSNFDAFQLALTVSPPVSIRLNAAKAIKIPFSKTSPIPWCNQGYYLTERPIFTLDPLFHAGVYYVQEASSMLIACAIKNQKFKRILDLCAAPGGKSTHLSSFLDTDGLLIACEPVPPRAHVLAENLAKWGCNQTLVLQCRPENLLPYFSDFFDLILVDAPCSGEGMFRKDPNSCNEWNTNSNHICAERQQQILDIATQLLAKDGTLLYSTCTYAEEENEHQILNILKSNPSLTPQPFEASAFGFEPKMFYQKNAYAYQAFWHKVQGEGFFLGKLVKNQQTKAAKKGILLKKQPSNVKKFSSTLPKEVLPYLPQEPLTCYTIAETVIHWQYPYEWLQAAATCGEILLAGLPILQLKGHDYIPHPALALSINCNKHNMIELNKADALQYLRKEAFEINLTNKWQMVGFEGIPLGWMKLIGNRVNNYWPKHWRIKYL